MGKKDDLSDFEHGMSARRAGLSISETADLHTQPSLGLTGNGMTRLVLHKESTS